jgi:hypothetical protein
MESLRPQPSSRATRLPPPALHHLPSNAAAETLSSPSSFDGRCASTATGAEAGGCSGRGGWILRCRPGKGLERRMVVARSGVKEVY